MRAQKPGDVVQDRYEVETYVAEGGMQEVYRAKDRVLQRNVALKVPKNTSAERRFRRSAVLSARVNHPNAAKTLDYLEEGERFYLIEEFLDGLDLKQLLARMPVMDPYLAAQFLHHLARGLAASHHVDVVHRDLKPSNIMVSADFSFSQIKITDFGIAKMAEEEFSQVEPSMSSTLAGAISYFSPEAVRDPKSSDKSRDVWAIAAIVYELMSGSKPFGEGNVAVPQILQGQLPQLPAAAQRCEQFKPLAEQIYSILTKCWAPQASARPTADQLVAMCGELCYRSEPRRRGTVVDYTSPSTGYIAADGGRVFFHTRCVYGDKPSIDDQVCFASFQGHPHPRACPLVRMK